MPNTASALATNRSMEWRDRSMATRNLSPPRRVREVHTLSDAAAAIQLAAKIMGEQLDELEGELQRILRLIGK